jgi:hypothetical protein
MNDDNEIEIIEEPKKPKAQVIDTIEKDGRLVLVYDNGMQKDKLSGRMVRGPDSAVINEQNAIAYQRRRAELRRAMVRDVAGRHAAALSFQNEFGDLAYLAAFVESVTLKAHNPKDPKQVDAVRWLQSAAGDTDDILDNGGVGEETEQRKLISDLAKIAQAALHLHAQKNSIDKGVS